MKTPKPVVRSDQPGNGRWGIANGSVAIALLLSSLAAGAQSADPGQSGGEAWHPTPAKGPLIEEFGPVYAIPDSVNPGPLQGPLKAAFDVSAVAIAPDALNPRIESVARYLNMHAASGVPAADIKAALVLHGGASRAVLKDAAYRQRYGVANPNLPLLTALHDAGVAIYLCGQSAASRGIAPEEISEPVNLALSAMTAHVQLQAQGFAVIPF